jgi:hypothetical protein
MTTNSRGQMTSTYDLILDVFPEGAEPFRAETHHQFGRHPDPGDSLKVRCNPEKRAVKIDLSDDARFNPKIYRKENRRKREEEHDRLLNAPPGAPAPRDDKDGDAEIAELMKLEEERIFGDDGADGAGRR